MRAKEFITEQELHPYNEKSLGNIMVIPELDQFYEYYRFMIAAAQSPDHAHEFKKETWIHKPAAISYTKADEEILNKALKLVGKTGKWLENSAAAEPKDTNKASPVNKTKRNRYGI
jgi:hypothetical protein